MLPIVPDSLYASLHLKPGRVSTGACLVAATPNPAPAPGAAACEARTTAACRKEVSSSASRRFLQPLTKARGGIARHCGAYGGDPGMSHIHAREMEELGRKLWGEPNAARSSRRDLRFGSHGSKRINLDQASWYDHEAGEGGGYADLYERVHGERPHESSIAAIYDYHDENGRLLFQVVRRTPKDFRQRRPDGNGGWIWSTKGIEFVPYRLPDLLKAAPHATMFVCEGEKDVDALRERGLVATTNPGGAGKWKAQYNRYFRGRRVAVLPDNDPQAKDLDGMPRFHPDGRPVLPGQDHAADVARNLQGVAASVTVLMLPDLPLKGRPV
jgi:hypothetical protein